MSDFSMTKYDFKNYLLACLNDSRQEDLILWKKNIPLPVDLVHRIFEEADALITSYCFHMISISILTQYFGDSNKLDTELNNFPCRDWLVKLDEVEKVFYHFSNTIITKRMIDALNEVFQFTLPEFKETDFINSISHDGRKYKRLYIPKQLKKQIESFQPILLDYAGTSNGDMFGNVVADFLHIYRSGFSDAFAAIFNKLLDFIIKYKLGSSENFNQSSRIVIKQSNDLAKQPNERIIFDQVSDGALWEPRYKNSSTVTVVNESHPYYKKLHDDDSKDLLFDITSKLSEMENNTVKDNERRIYEMIRFELSRTLRIQSDK